MLYFVSRQKYWPEGNSIVEIACGGLDYAGADMLVPKYRHLGEGKEFNDPREAVEAGIQILRTWKADGEKRARLAYGSTGGMTMPFEPCTIKEAETWAEKAWEKLPKCDGCSSVLPKETYTHELAMNDEKFCSERCAEKDYIHHCEPIEENENE